MTVSILGTNDAAVISGDVDGVADGNRRGRDGLRQARRQRRRQLGDFLAQSGVAGSNGYGTFAIDASGAWTYTTSPEAHNEFEGGVTYTDSFTVSDVGRHDAGRDG